MSSVTSNKFAGFAGNEVECEIEFITRPVAKSVPVVSEATLVAVSETTPCSPILPTHTVGEYPCLIAKHSNTGYELTYFVNDDFHKFAMDKTPIHLVVDKCVMLIDFVGHGLPIPLRFPLPDGDGLCDYESIPMDITYDNNKRALIVRIMCVMPVEHVLTNPNFVAGNVTKDGYLRYITTIFSNPLKYDKNHGNVIWIKSKFSGFDTNIVIGDEYDVVDVKYLLGVVKVTVVIKVVEEDVPLIVETVVDEEIPQPANQGLGGVERPTTVVDEIPQQPMPIIEKKKLKLTYNIGERPMIIMHSVSGIDCKICYCIEDLSKHMCDECFTHEISGDFILVSFTKQELEEPLKFPLPVGLCDFSKANLSILFENSWLSINVENAIVPCSFFDKENSGELRLDNGNSRYPSNMPKISGYGECEVKRNPPRIWAKSKFDGFDALITPRTDREITNVKYEKEFVTVIYKPYPKQFTYVDGEYEKFIEKHDKEPNVRYKFCYGVDVELYEFFKTAPHSISKTVVGRTICINNAQNPMKIPLALPLPKFPFGLCSIAYFDVKIHPTKCRILIEITHHLDIELGHYTKAQIDSLNGSYNRLVFEKNIVTNPCKSIIKRNKTYITLLTKSVFDGFDTEFEYNFTKKFKDIQENDNETILEFEQVLKYDELDAVKVFLANRQSDNVELPEKKKRGRPRKADNADDNNTIVKKHKQNYFDGNEIVEIDATKNTISFTHNHDKTREIRFSKPPEIKNAENGGWNYELKFADFNTRRDVTDIEIDILYGRLWIYVFAEYADKTVTSVASVALHQSIANKNLNATGKYNMETNDAIINIMEAK